MKSHTAEFVSSGQRQYAFRGTRGSRFLKGSGLHRVRAITRGDRLLRRLLTFVPLRRVLPYDALQSALGFNGDPSPFELARSSTPIAAT